MDRQRLHARLVERFEADQDVARIVAREATDLADRGVYEADFDESLGVEIVITNLADAPDGSTLAERWNWWLGALELSHGAYQRFRVRPDVV
ncbi:hypothetical protein [Halorhabdus sp. CUG00001]|uniref:hypothetical protein n=1 Tax=Halorhabdus sp. CUG00001 TaxID=2600297 RepID=UPI00131CA24C|nr:hypothetical protein [Halorhabdus sp. CUG00001]